MLHALRRLATAQHRTATLAARVIGMNPTSWTILCELSIDGELTNGEIAGRLGMSTGGVTPALYRLESDGLVHRSPNPDDKRSTILTITAAGQGRLDSVHAELALRLQPTLETLEPDMSLELGRVLEAATDAYVGVHRSLRG